MMLKTALSEWVWTDPCWPNNSRAQRKPVLPHFGFSTVSTCTEFVSFIFVFLHSPTLALAWPTKFFHFLFSPASSFLTSFSTTLTHSLSLLPFFHFLSVPARHIFIHLLPIANGFDFTFTGRLQKGKQEGREGGDGEKREGALRNQQGTKRWKEYEGED